MNSEKAKSHKITALSGHDTNKLTKEKESN